MKKAIELAKKMQDNLSDNWSEQIEEYGLDHIFLPVYNGPERIKDKNTIICYIIHAYNPDSFWLDLRKDRIDNKKRILAHLGADIKSELYKGIIANKNEIANISIFNFLEELKDWRWRSVFDLIEYASRMSRFAAMETSDEKQYEKTSKDGQIQKYKEEVDIKVIVNVNKGKGELIEQSIEARRNANKMLDEIQKEYVTTDNATQQDFGFSFTETAKKRDILSWRHFIKDLKEKGVDIR